MPSEKLLNELYGIAQRNVSEEINYNQFIRDLINSTKLENSEYDTYLNSILNKVKNNEKSFGQYSNGTFIVSENIIKTAEAETKINRQFVPGTEEYKERITSEKSVKGAEKIELIDNLLADYSKLDLEGKLELFSRIQEMDKKQFLELKRKNSEDRQKAVEEGILDEDENREIDNAWDSLNNIQFGNKEIQLLEMRVLGAKSR